MESSIAIKTKLAGPSEKPMNGTLGQFGFYIGLEVQFNHLSITNLANFQEKPVNRVGTG